MLNEGSVVSGSGCCQRVAQPPPLGTCVSEGPGASPPPLGCQHSCVRVHASSSRSGGNIRQIRQPMCSPVSEGQVAQPPPPPPLGCQHSGVRVHASGSRSGGNIRQIRQPMCSATDAWVQGTGKLHNIYTSQDKKGNCRLCKQAVIHQCAAPQSKFGVKVGSCGTYSVDNFCFQTSLQIPYSNGLTSFCLPQCTL